MSTPSIAWLGSAGALPDDLSNRLRLVGGKANSLHELTAAGFAVPEAFAITTTAYDSALEPVRRAFFQDSRRDWSSLRQRIESATLPQGLADAIIQCRRSIPAPMVAVRSSAPKEDSALASFAGQYDTILYVSSDEQLLAAVKKCWGSLYSDRVVAYRKKTGADLVWERMGVVVQAMVDPAASGIAFSINPVTYCLDEITIEGGFGVGEAFVSGQAPADRWTVAKAKHRSYPVLTSDIKTKEFAMVRRGDHAAGTEMRPLPVQQQRQPCLTSSQLSSLAQTVHEVQHKMFEGASQVDVEWCVTKEGKVLVLQARPITTIFSRDELMEPELPVQHDCLFTRNDIGESFSGLKTPLSLSFGDMFNRVFTPSSFWALGLPNCYEAEHFLRSFNGHMYINVSWMTAASSQCVPLRDDSNFLEKYGTNAGIDMSSYKNPFNIPALRKTIYPTMYWLGNFMREKAFGDSRVQDAEQIRKVEEERFLALDLTKMSNLELGAEMQRAIDLYHLACEWYFPAWLNTMMLYDFVVMLARSTLGREIEHKLPQLVKLKIVETRTVELTEALWKLAVAAKQSAVVRGIFVNNDGSSEKLSKVPELLKNCAEGQAFWSEHMWPFLTTHGIRGHQEMELTFARWIDDPVYVVSMVRRYICDDFDFDKWRSRLQDTSVEDEQVKSELLGRMPGMKRTIMKMLLRDYVKAGEDREIIRPSWVLATWFLHRITAEAGKRLVTEGVLSAATDVAYVTLYELRDWLGGSGPARQYFNPAHIEHNRRLHKYRMALPDPPFSFVGRPQYPDLAAEAKKDTLVGLGASAGQVRGRVRVILDLEREASAFTAGEILVTKVTDPAWTPLFIEASAVVAETGGLLSHTSIVAREFGIPAIVNVSAVTHVLKTGMEVTVDGTTGRLTIHR